MLKTRYTCRICGSTKLLPVLSLGEQYLASNFAISEDFPAVQRKIPLDLVRCAPELDERACGFVQLKHTVSPDLMYSSYGYRSGINRTMTTHLQSLASRLEKEIRLQPGDLVVDIGANDGTLLLGYQTRGIHYVGFEPSNIEPAEPLPHVTFARDYFSAEHVGALVPGRKAKIVTSIAMFYDLDDPGAFVADIARILDDEGVWVLELSYLALMLEKNSFDTICHEHLGYYSLFTLERLLHMHGLRVADVELNDINGGSFRVFVMPSRGRYTPQKGARSRIYKLRVREFESKLDTDEPYGTFERRIHEIRAELRGLLEGLKSQGRVIYGYGASTKGNVILQFFGLGPSLIEGIADRNPAKWGTQTLGTDIPIISEEAMRQANPDYLLILPWHFLEEFREREHAFLARGGKFIVPVPRPQIII